MKASTLEFRFRVVIMLAILLLGFWSPWIEWLGEWLHLGARSTTWLWLGFQFGGLGLPSIHAIQCATAVAVVIAAAGAALRVWGTAYLGTETVNSSKMHAGIHTGTAQDATAKSAPDSDRVLADGPYRYVRNPLYIGSFLTMAAIAVLMPPSGTAVSLVLLAVFLFRLILGEEGFLAGKLGARYLAYKGAVPRLFPALRTLVVASGQAPRWGRALLGELMPIGVFLSFATLSWQYNAGLVERAVLISFGVSLVVRALLVSRPS